MENFYFSKNNALFSKLVKRNINFFNKSGNLFKFELFRNNTRRFIYNKNDDLEEYGIIY